MGPHIKYGQTAWGKLHQGADMLLTAHGLFKAARWVQPHIVTGLRAALL